MADLVELESDYFSLTSPVDTLDGEVALENIDQTLNAVKRRVSRLRS